MTKKALRLSDMEDVAPHASTMIESMRAYGYTLPAAIADLIDNSIAADARNIWLRFEWDSLGSWVSVTDDGRGMKEEELRDAMRLGSRSPLEEREATDLGRFGLGLKTASLSQCRRLTVASRTTASHPAVRRWDLDFLGRKDVDGWKLLKHPERGSEGRLTFPAKASSGTVVLWELLDRLVGDAEGDEELFQSDFLRMVESVEQHVAMVFHRFLSRTKRRLSIWLNGREVAAWDPFLETHPATARFPVEKISLAGFEQHVEVKSYILPHKDKLGAEAHQAASGPAGWNAQQGFYVYRSGRLILPGSWLGLGGSRPWVKEEHFKLARIRLDIPTSMDHIWQLDVKKSTAHPPSVIRGRLKAVASAVRADARSVYAHRGKYSSRVRRGDLPRAWTSVKRDGAFTYRINRDHPLVRAALRTAPEELGQLLEAMLRIIEETVPVQQIWLDEADQPGGHALPLQGSPHRELQHLISVTYSALKQVRGLDHDCALAALGQLEEFTGHDAQAIIGLLKTESLPE